MWFLSFLFGTLFGDKLFGINLNRLFGGDSLSDHFFNGDALVSALVGTPTPAAPPPPPPGVSGWTTADIQALPGSLPGSTKNIGTLTTAAIALFNTDDIRAFTTDGIAALSSGLLAALTTIDVQALTTDQVVALTTLQFSGLTTGTLNALTSDQVVAIETQDIQALSNSQIAKLSTDFVQALVTDQIQALRTGQIQALSTADVAILTTDQAMVLGTAQIVALTTAQFAVLSTDDVVVLSTDQVIAIETVDIAALKTAQVAALTTDQVVALTTAQIRALTSAEVVALTTDQIVSLTTSQASAISTAGVAALTTDELIAFETADLAALTNAQISALTSAQTVVFTTDQVEAFTSDQISAFTIPAYQQLNTFGTPIVLDLNGDGVKTLGAEAGVRFDLFASGHAINTGWVSGGDGLLVLDRNRDGQINDGSELFGSSTTLANGQKAPDGYAALREFDTNQDGVIDSKDAVYNDLRVWIDSNSDGVTESGELRTLQSLGIVSISVQALAGTEMDHGNILGLTSSYETTDGVSHAAADVWFRVDGDGDHSSAAVDSAIAALSSASSPAAALGVEFAYSLPASVVATLAQAPPPPAGLASVTNSNDLRFKVSSLAQVIGSFADAAETQSNSATLPLSAPTPSNSGGTPVALAVVGMVDVMKQFDANGNLIGGTSPTPTAATQPLTGASLQSPNATAFLVAEGKT